MTKIDTLTERFKRQDGDLVTYVATPTRDEFLEILQAAGFDVPDGCNWQVVNDNTNTIRLQASYKELPKAQKPRTPKGRK